MSISRIRAAKSRLAATITLYSGIVTLPPATIVFRKYEINSNKGFDDKMTPFNLAMDKIEICGIDIKSLADSIKDAPLGTRAGRIFVAFVVKIECFLDYNESQYGKNKLQFRLIKTRCSQILR